MNRVKVSPILTGETVLLCPENGKCLSSYDFIDKNRYCSTLMWNIKAGPVDLAPEKCAT